MTTYEIKPIEIDRFDDYYYMRKLSQLNNRLGFCGTLAEYSYAYRDQSLLGSALSPSKKLADCAERKLVMAAFNGKGQTVGMAGLSYKPRDSKGAAMVYLWGVYVEKPHRGQGIAKRMISASFERIKAELGCTDDELVLTVMDSQFDQNALVNLPGKMRGENHIDQGLGFDADPSTISQPKIPKAS